MHKIFAINSMKSFRFLSLALVALMSFACKADETWIGAGDPSQFYWKLRLDHHAVQLSTAGANTIQLTATSMNPFDELWTPPASADVEETIWTSSDSSKVKVTQQGLVTAIAPTTAVVRVIASKRVNNVRLADTIQVRVVTTAPQTVSEFTIRPEDSLKVAEKVNKLITGRIVAAGNDTLRGVPFYLTVTDTAVANVTSRWSAGSQNTTITIQGKRPGTTLVTAEANIFGTIVTDTFTLTVGYPITAGSRIFNSGQGVISLSNPQHVVGPGATISWTNVSGGSGVPGQPFDVVFDNPDAALAPAGGLPTESGNIMQIPSDTLLSEALRTRQRRFLNPGTYSFTIPQFSLSGSVVVKEE